MIASVMAIIIAMTFHEFAHAQVAVWNGDNTPKAMGRLTFNPIKHIDPFGFILLLVAGFGFAKPVPVNPLNFRKQRKGIFTTAIAGVTTNLVLAFIFAIFVGLIWVLGPVDIFVSAGGIGVRLYGYSAADSIIHFFFWFLLSSTTINVVLIIFNLLPIFPLDGFRVIESFTRHDNKIVVFMRKYGSFILMGLIGMNLIFQFTGLRGTDAYRNVLRYFDFFGFYFRYGVNFIAGSFIRLWGLFWGAIF
ncbi:MAG: site-2 protease family protein [Firmicutes bacterium]|nr:site-2 protease family protein [Bacillota bacterium]